MNTSTTTNMLSAIESLCSNSSNKQISSKKRIAEMDILKIGKRVFREVGNAIKDFDMIKDGDRIMVAISGGKDSWVLLYVLNELRKKAPVSFEIVAVNIDQGYAGFRQDLIENWVDGQGYEFHMEDFDIAGILEEKADEKFTPCSLCARLRRGALYGYAEKYKCNKIALGHHQDDFIETLLLNQLFIGTTASMAPKLISDDGKNIVIRPLVYTQEESIKRYARHLEVPIVCCQCPLMCGETVHGDYKRRMVKQLIDHLELGIPELRNSLLASLKNIKPSHMLDKSKFDF